MMLPMASTRPPKQALTYSKARVFVGQLEPYVTETDLYPVFSCYGRILYLNVVRHSTTVTPNEERRIPTAFVWYETTAEADAAIAALHNVFTFSSPDEEEAKKRYIQVSYADKSPQCTPWGKWQKKHAEMQRHSAAGQHAQKKSKVNNNSNSNGNHASSNSNNSNSGVRAEETPPHSARLGGTTGSFTDAASA